MGEGHWTESHPLTASKDVMPLPRLAPGTLRWWIVGVLGKGIVGTVTGEVPAGESRVQRSVEIRTAQRAVTGVVDSCVRH